MQIIKSLSQFIWKYKDIFGLFLIIFLLYLLFKRPRPVVIPVAGKHYEELVQERAKNGRLVAVINQWTVTKKELERENDSLARLLNIKPKHIQGATVYTTKIDTVFRDTSTVTVITELKDTTFIAEYEDAWVTQKAVVNKDSSRLYLAVRDTPVVFFTQKNPLFGKSKAEVKIYHSNPYIKAETGYSYKLRPKEPILVIGPGVGYDPFGRRFSFNIQATVPLIKIKR